MVIVRLKSGQIDRVDGGASVRVDRKGEDDPPSYGAGGATEVLLVMDELGEVLREFDNTLVADYAVD